MHQISAAVVVIAGLAPVFVGRTLDLPEHRVFLSRNVVDRTFIRGGKRVVGRELPRFDDPPLHVVGVLGRIIIDDEAGGALPRAE